MRKVVVGLGLLAVCVVAFSALGFNQWLNTPLKMTETNRTLVIGKGGSVSRLAYQLEQKGLVCNPRLLIAYARLTGQENIKVGEYRFKYNVTPKQMMAELVAGNVVSYQLTLVEGWTVKQALEYIQSLPNVMSTLKSREEIVSWFEQSDLPKANPEGWLFPDTYQFEKGTVDTEILQRAVTRMQQVLEQEWQGRAQGLPYQTAYDALIMASIVEKETGVASEREQIAGVFVRRLQKGMRLQTDPTIIYGLGESYKGNIRRKHLRQPTPYNTYVIKGLPPTPIALAGREAISAALHPDDGTALYFVAKGDGSHYFSDNLKDHEAAVRKYQLRRSDDYRSSPAASNTSAQSEANHIGQKP
jgi:peptidoglycan lytic transglycosylase G